MKSMRILFHILREKKERVWKIISVNSMWLSTDVIRRKHMLNQPLFCTDVHPHPGLVTFKIQLHHNYFHINIISASLFPVNHKAQTLYMLGFHLLITLLTSESQGFSCHSMKYLILKSQLSLLAKHHHSRKSHLFSHNFFICKKSRVRDNR